MAALSFRPGIVIPVFDHAAACAAVIEQLRPLGLPLWLVDDGSGPAGQQALARLAGAEAGWITLARLPANRGKGAAVTQGLRLAAAAGCTHALQIDADGQHEVADAGRLLDAARAQPRALVTGVPVYDASVPPSRLYGRYITHFWVWIHTGSRQIRDSMCGFRVYPLADTLAIVDRHRLGPRMEFDTEIMVRLAWAGTPVVNLPTRVRYPPDGISHFRLWRDNLRISWMHTRLFFTMLGRRLRGLPVAPRHRGN